MLTPACWPGWLSMRNERDIVPPSRNERARSVLSDEQARMQGRPSVGMRLLHT
jgi:hypothetical protein